MASDVGALVVSAIIGIIILAVLIWLYVEQCLYLFQPQNFTAQGWTNWRRILTIVFVILALVGLVIAAIGLLFTGSTSGFSAKYKLY